MKKLILAATALSMIASPVLTASASAAPARHDNGRQTVVVKKAPTKVVVKKTTVRKPVVQQRRWAKGQRFDRRYATNYRTVDYRGYRGHGLYAPPRGYQWVRSGDDAVLVGITTGLIAAVIANAIR